VEVIEMELKKRHIVSAVVALRISSYVIDRKEEIDEMYYLICTSEYIASIEKLIRFITGILEYVITLS
jgi:hypothetical protein